MTTRYNVNVRMVRTDDDGLVDYPEDLGASSLNDDDEQNDLPPPECADGVDNGRWQHR